MHEIATVFLIILLAETLFQIYPWESKEAKEGEIKKMYRAKAITGVETTITKYTVKAGSVVVCRLSLCATDGFGTDK